VLAFVRTQRESWIHFLDGSGREPLKLARGFSPALSPDRRTLAYCSAPQEGKSLLLLLDIATRRETPLLSPGKHVRNPRWSPAGDQIAFLTFGQGSWEVHIVMKGGSSERRVFPPEGEKLEHLVGPEWSSDQRSLFCHDLENVLEIGLDGRLLSKTPLATIAGEPKVVALEDPFVPCPTDADLAIYTRRVAATALLRKAGYEWGSALFLYRKSSGKSMRLSRTGLTAQDPVWSRDGSEIYFCGFTDKEANQEYPYKIYLLRKDGTGLTQITRGEQPAN
jgi:Tol biopolymer transport system component